MGEHREVQLMSWTVMEFFVLLWLAKVRVRARLPKGVEATLWAMPRRSRTLEGLEAGHASRTQDP